MTDAPSCVCGCGRPSPDAYLAAACAYRTSDRLHEIADMAPAARDVAQRQTAGTGGSGAGKPGSQLPIDLGATARLDKTLDRLTAWSRQIAAERGIVPPWVTTYGEPLSAVSVWLSGHTEWIRHLGPARNVGWLTAVYGPRPWPDFDPADPPIIASEFVADVDAAHRVVRGIARGPSEQKYLGPCGADVISSGIDPDGWPADVDIRTCDGDVYAYRGAAVGRCRACGAEVDTRARSAWLDELVRSHAFRDTEIADALGISVKTIRSWATERPESRNAAGKVVRSASPAKLLAHAHDREGRPLYVLGHVAALAEADALKRHERHQKRADS